MNYPVVRNQRSSIRLQGWDYSSRWYYFVTTRIHDPRIVLSEIKNARVELSPIGEMVQTQWLGLSGRFPDVEINEYIILPDQFHGLIRTSTPADAATDWISERTTVSRVMQAFKSITTTS
jgi:hypothetical protein